MKFRQWQRACYISVRVFASAVCNARPPQHRRGQNCGLYQLAVLPARRVHRSTFCSCNTRPDTDRRAAGPCRPGLCAPCETSSARLVLFAWVTRKGRGWCHDRSPGSERRGENLKIFFDRARKFRTTCTYIFFQSEKYRFRYGFSCCDLIQIEWTVL